MIFFGFCCWIWVLYGFLWVWNGWVFVGGKGVGGWWSGNATDRRELSEANFRLAGYAKSWYLFAERALQDRNCFGWWGW